MITFFKRRPKAAVLGLLLIILLGVTLIPIPTLLVGEQQGKTVVAIPLLLDKNFTYAYLHSVLKTPVQESFTLAPGNDLLLTSTTYQSLGVGTPFLPGEGKLENRNGRYVLTGQNRRFRQLNFGVIPFTDQAILHSGQTYMFKDYFASGTLIQLQVERWNIARILATNLREEVRLERP